ncbi:MAG: RagB/SusD family nutrient uptake outer membrane protein [Gemmatimonadetes bacterium]|nr:RagB/SusD family nutrient uptake outer membrane protein [Gemmatimonadota bacterium]MCC6769743.1 RagB/SusD family nutrient uptake outer membrane protein [Gemmatimonadaceae bacterium]
MRVNRIVRLASATVAFSTLAATGGCNFFDVSNPGPIADDNLNVPSAMAGLTTGMAFNLSEAYNSLSPQTALLSDDLYHAGSYGPGQGLWNRGIVRPEDINGSWGDMHAARWVAEQGIERMKTVLGTGYDTSPFAARANIYAGLANRMLGEVTCNSVIDGGPSGDHKVHFQRAEAQFSEAIRIAGGLTGALRDSLLRVAHGGRASVRAWQNNWTGAVTDAQIVPSAYVFVAPFSTNTAAENNELAFETINRSEYTVFGTFWSAVRDPRVPWDTVRTTSGALATGQDGRTVFFRQRKFINLAADIPIVKGTEMLLVRAEAALRNNDVPGAMTLINQVRAFHNVATSPLPPLTATTLAEAWPILQRERGATLWLESRRLWDLRRWNAETGPAKNTFLDNRDKCIPISLNEIQANPNLRGT